MQIIYGEEFPLFVHLYSICTVGDFQYFVCNRSDTSLNILKLKVSY